MPADEATLEYDLHLYFGSLAIGLVLYDKVLRFEVEGEGQASQDRSMSLLLSRWKKAG